LEIFLQKRKRYFIKNKHTFNNYNLVVNPTLFLPFKVLNNYQLNILNYKNTNPTFLKKPFLKGHIINSSFKKKLTRKASSGRPYFHRNRNFYNLQKKQKTYHISFSHNYYTSPYKENYGKKLNNFLLKMFFYKVLKTPNNNNYF